MVEAFDCEDLIDFDAASDFERSDGDGGEELPLPTVREAELAAMVASVGVQ